MSGTVFDVCGPLPTGTTVLEASAGTGKTFTIAALATRYVTEGVAELRELLLVTFGRAATSELRDRVRERLVATHRALHARDPRADPDAFVRHLAGVPDAELARRRARLTRALAQFDAATIATTHGFCQQMLAALGVVGDVDSDAVLVPDLADLADEVVDDVYLQRFADSRTPALGVAEARAAARAAVGDPHALLGPTDAPADSPAAHRYAFARDVLAELGRRKRTRRVLDYDDLLVLLRDALADPAHGAHACERVRAQYRLVLVDEFQDTDPVQWEILRRAFHGHRTMVLIGDPKQAIYAFRGGDVVAYLEARAAAGAEATLGRSWRSDAPLLRGIDAIFGSAALGDPAIVVRPLEAEHAGRRLSGGAPVRLRQVTRAAFGRKGTQNPRVGDVRQLLAADVAADIVRQLSTTRLQDAAGPRELRPADIAVLARRNADATTVRDALAAAGVPAVVSGLSSVFGSPSARDWLTLLAALEQPGHAGRTAALALTPFVGWDAARLAAAGDAERDALSDRVRAWARLLAGRGVAAVLEAASADGLAERLLATDAGERALTDLRHVAQELHLTALAGELGAAALADWLRSRVADAEQDYAEDRSRRLETDAAAVQVVTVHASKGLEFPVVYVPFGWDRYEGRAPAVLRYHGPDGRRRIHVGGESDPDYPAARDRHLDEERGEDLRLLYVALTRARSQLVIWWAPSSNSAGGPLTRLLLADVLPGAQPPPRVTPGRDEAVAASFEALAARAPGAIALEQVTAAPGAVRWVPPAPARPPLAAATPGPGPDTGWSRTSYSRLTAAAHAEAAPAGTALTAEPEQPGIEDEPELAGPAPEPPAPDPADPVAAATRVPSPMAGLPGGTAFGTLVHTVLEGLDTAAPDLPAELLRACADPGVPRLPGADPAALAAALAPVLATPLGPLADGRTLADVRPADRLAELEFELPLAGGDAPRPGAATVGDIADLVRRHLPAGDPFAGYPDRLAGLGPARLRGYLTGSLDAVLRLRGDGPPRYVIVDYKTNRLAPPDEPLTAWHYRPAALVPAMSDAHYPLQLLLYSVALHRYLRWRQPAYDPGVHLGGALYLFVRGMCGAATPVVGGAPCGVLGWRPPPGLVVALSALLDGLPDGLPDGPR